MAPNAELESESCHTQVQVLPLVFYWTITEIPSLQQEVGQYLSSSIFSPDGGRTKWRLNYYPNGYNAESTQFQAVYLQLMESKSALVGAKFMLTLLTKEGKESGISAGSKRTRTFRKGTGYGVPNFLAKDLIFDDLLELLHNNELHIKCKLWVVNDPHFKDTKSVVEKPEDPNAQLGQDLAAILNSSQWSDVTLICEGREFPCHKAILASRSPIFNAMFTHQNSREVLTNKVEIEDMEPKVLSELLTFIYTGSCSIEEGLLAAADKYILPRLKSRCESLLWQKIDDENCCRILNLADQHSAFQLKKNALDYFFMGGDLEAIMKTKGWTGLITTKPHLLTELYKTAKGLQIRFERFDFVNSQS